MAEAPPPTRHVGGGIALREAFHERLRRERDAVLAEPGGGALPAERRGVVLVEAATVLDGVAESLPTYTLFAPDRERKKPRRKRQRAAAEAKQACAAGGRAAAAGVAADADSEVRAKPFRNEKTFMPCVLISLESCL